MTTPSPNTGLLLVNLGTPDAPTPKAVRRYLREFLSDPRVVAIPPLIWQPILHAAILPFRPKQSAHAYAQVWTDRGSPLAVITQDQAAAMQAALGDTVRVDYAMRYGNPSIPAALDTMQAAGCQTILIAPLYPQSCTATTASVEDAIVAYQANRPIAPLLRIMPTYHDDLLYIDALKTSVEQSLATLDFAPDILAASFHGMPERTRTLGDPYYDQCHATARLVSAALGRPVEVCFQSRFGRAKWLEPATDVRLRQWASEGKKVTIFAPGFSADCLETLEELAIRGREQFREAGGTHFAYLPCLNTSIPGMMMLEALIRRHLP